jgi:hypothetical protein
MPPAASAHVINNAPRKDISSCKPLRAKCADRREHAVGVAWWGPSRYSRGEMPASARTAIALYATIASLMDAAYGESEMLR